MATTLMNAFHQSEGKGAWYGIVETIHKQTKIHRDEIRNYLRGQDAYTLNRRVVKKFPRRRIFAAGIDEIWQADILQLPGTKTTRGWQGIKYSLNVIDVVSKKAWTRPLSKKNATVVTEAF